MSREVRKVRSDWEHPRYTEANAPFSRAVGAYIPMFYGSYTEAVKDWLEMANEKGLQEAIDCYGEAPEPEEYMPDWPEHQRTHFMMYEATSKGTPISPAFATPEELAQWLVDNNASAFAGQTASYKAWLRIARGGFAPSAEVMDDWGIVSGVEALKDEAE